jgi:hypothetical protein
MAIPLAAAGATDMAKALDLGSARWWGLFLFAQLITLLGYAASSLSQWAGWVDGTVLAKLTIIQGVACSLMAGNIAFLLGLHYAQVTEVQALIASGAGGYGGDKLLTPLLNRIFGKATGDK